MTPLERITERVMCRGHPEDRSVPKPLLTLEEFFDGNDEVGSFGCNLDSEPEPSEFRNLFVKIRSRLDVSDIRIQITCVDSPGELWPFSDTVWIITTTGVNDVRDWFPAHLAPNEVWEGFLCSQKYEDYPIPAGYRAIAVWYD